MKKLKYFLIGFILASTVFFGCQDLDAIKTPAEYDLTNKFGLYVDTTIYASDAIVKIDDRINTANGRRLCVGEYNGFKAGFFLKFVGLPSTDVEIDSVYLILRSHSIFGKPEGEQEIAMYLVEEEWDEWANTEDQWHAYQPQHLLATFQLSNEDTMEFKTLLDTAIVNQWRRSDSTNYGLFFKPVNGANFIREFVSLEDEYDIEWPKLYYKIIQDTVFYQDSLRLGIDATIFDYEPQGANIFDWAKEQGDFVIGSGIGAHLIVQFPGLDSLPKNAVFQGADLHLEVDNRDFFTNEEGNTFDNSSVTSYFYVRNIVEADSAFENVKLDSSFVSNSNFSYLLKEVDGQIQMVDGDYQSKFGKNFFQNLVNGEISSKGFYLRYLDETSMLSFKRIKGLNGQTISLKIRYFLETDNSF